MDLFSAYIGEDFKEKSARWSMIAIALAFTWVAWVEAPLAWDGAFKLFSIIQKNTLIISEERGTCALIQLLTLVVLRHSLNISLLTFIFCASHCFVYLFMAHLCVLYTDTKESLRLRIWPFLYFGLIGIWAQTYFISETVMAPFFAWPIFLKVILNKSKETYLLAVLLFFLNPTSAIFFVFFGLVSMLDRENRRTKEALLWWFTGLIRLILVAGANYEVGILKDYSQIIRETLRGLPLYGCVLGSIFSILFVFKNRVSNSLLKGLRLYAGLGILLIIVFWSLSPTNAVNSLQFRFNLSFFSIFFMSLCWLDCRLSQLKKSEIEPLLKWGMLFPSIIWSLALIALGFRWSSGKDVLLRAFYQTQDNCIEHKDVKQFSTSMPALFTVLSIVAQKSLSPRKILLEDGECDRNEFKDSIPIVNFEPRHPRKDRLAFDFSATGLP